MTTATIGDRFQLVIPRAERERLRLKPRMKMTVSVENDAIVIRPASIRALRGIGAELKDGTDATDYVRELRAEWETRP